MSGESKLYKACCDGDLKKVKNLLETLSLDEINHFEPNGSTALHVSCCHGHLNIVRALLEHGASRRQPDKNCQTPEDEARNEQIKALFRRSPKSVSERFVSEMPNLEWMIAGSEGFQTACDNIYLSKKFTHLKEANKIVCNATELHDAQGMDQVCHLLLKAEQTNDVTYMVRAYTAETDFYKLLNCCHAQLSSRGHTEEERGAWFVKFGKTLHKAEQLDQYRWTGRTYRGIHIMDKDLDQYKVNDYIVNKAFLSTSKSRHIAEQFMSMSEYPEEEEVLILPNACFKVERINRQIHPIEIELSSW